MAKLFRRGISGGFLRIFQEANLKGALRTTGNLSANIARFVDEEVWGKEITGIGNRKLGIESRVMTCTALLLNKMVMVRFAEMLGKIIDEFLAPP